MPCKCNNFDPKYINDHHQHILTGDLNIIDNVRLRDIILKGPKYREPCTINFESATDSIRDQLDLYIEQICAKKKASKATFDAWKNEVMNRVEHKIDTVQNSHTFSSKTSILNEASIKSKLSELHDAFVFSQ